MLASTCCARWHRRGSGWEQDGGITQLGRQALRAAAASLPAGPPAERPCRRPCRRCRRGCADIGRQPSRRLQRQPSRGRAVLKETMCASAPVHASPRASPLSSERIKLADQSGARGWRCWGTAACCCCRCCCRCRCCRRPATPRQSARHCTMHPAPRCPPARPPARPPAFRPASAVLPRALLRARPAPPARPGHPGVHRAGGGQRAHGAGEPAQVRGVTAVGPLPQLCDGAWPRAAPC